MMNNIITKKANGSTQIAKTIIEMADDDYYLIDYSLPNLVFAKEGERVDLPSCLQALVEEKMNMLNNNENKIISTNLLGLAELANGKQPSTNGNDVVVYLDSLGKIDCAQVTAKTKIPEYPPSILKVILKNVKKYAKNSRGYIYIAASLLEKIYKLEKNK